VTSLGNDAVKHGFDLTVIGMVADDRDAPVTEVLLRYGSTCHIDG
jgi:hypothetical protein